MDTLGGGVSPGSLPITITEVHLMTELALGHLQWNLSNKECAFTLVNNSAIIPGIVLDIINKTLTGFCRIFATELEDRRPKTVPYLEEVVE